MPQDISLELPLEIITDYFNGCSDPERDAWLSQLPEEERKRYLDRIKQLLVSRQPPQVVTLSSAGG